MAGGFVLVASENDKILGVVIMNQTGMEEYIPENILVYIAVHRDYRGKGLGKNLMKESMVYTKGTLLYMWSQITQLNFFMKS